MKQFALIFVFVVTLVGCKNNQIDSYQEIAALNTENETDLHPGKQLMETYCYVCHAPKEAHEQQIAPPMIAVKKHYLNDGISKEDFITSIENWVHNPNEDNARMYGAIRQFGLMPKTAYPENTVQLIADYIYDNNIEEPEWFAEHYQNRGGKGKGKGKGKWKNSIN